MKDNAFRSHNQIASMAARIYEPLPQNVGEQYIRTCTLYPGTGDESLRIELEPYQLDSDDAEYEALSWIWGSPSNSTVLVYKGQNISTRKSLDDALRDFRYADRTRTLWVDALCINQEDWTKDHNRSIFVCVQGSDLDG